MTITNYKNRRQGIIISYLVMAIGVALFANSDSQLIALGILFMAGGLHLHRYRIRFERIYWATMANPLAIIDWGQDKRMADAMPEHLEGQFITEAAKNVACAYEHAIEQLEANCNILYQSRQHKLPVYTIYFRDGVHANESQEEYINRVIRTMNEARVQFHDQLRTKQGDYYLKQYLESGLNGSRV